MKLLCLALLTIAALAGSPASSHGETLTGVAAQKSPQADVFLAYEKAMISGGMEAAKPYMTPAKVADLNGMAAAFGAAGFEKVEIDGDQAVLEARDDPHTVSVAPLTRTKDRWKIDVRPIHT